MSKTTEKTKIAATLALIGACCGCANVKSFLAMDSGAASNVSGPIHNPFGEQYASGGAGDRSQNMILRTKKGDRAVEIELPRDAQNMTDFSIPVSPAFRDSRAGGRNPASVGDSYGSPVSDDGTDDTAYVKHPPSMADREITHSFPQSPADRDGERRTIEQNLGLMPSDDGVPSSDSSYLGALDHVKTLFRSGRYEAGLVEIDGLLKQYPTSPKLHLMRGTLLDRIGQPDLALKSWNQALRLSPNNASLRKFIERKQQIRSLASP